MTAERRKKVRLMRWGIGFVILSTLVVGTLLIDQGYAPAPREFLRQLADRPETGTMFKDASSDRFDATVFLYTVLVIAPLAALAALAALAIALVMVEVTIIPVARKLGVPDGFMHAVLLIVGAATVYFQSAVWLPGSLKLLGLVARAYLIAST